MSLRLAWGLLPLIFVAADQSSVLGEYQSSHHHRVTSTAAICEPRSINYITHSLPQLCFTSTWTSATQTRERSSVATPSPTEPTNLHIATENGTITTSVTDAIHATTTISPSESDLGADSSSSESEASSFMSFEDWKEMMLRKTGQDPQNLRSHKNNGRHYRERVPPDIGNFELGEEDEISLDFDDYLERPEQGSYLQPDTRNVELGDYETPEAVILEGERAPLHRSKDAGRTCKERFSYSSFDAGATVLKTSPGAKNAKAILVENKDSYMLLECAMGSKYVIVELSDDILIDTLVLANFEFFSSMIRHFRVSVSDRYPVKMERWKDIGTFEARNSRDIQAFLVENPQIFSKYVRIEFLTHYGNEYYCPISLLRVHGSRMFDSFKDSADDEEIAIDSGGESRLVDGVSQHEPAESLDEGVRNLETANESFTPWSSDPNTPFNLLFAVCQARDCPGEMGCFENPHDGGFAFGTASTSADSRKRDKDFSQETPKSNESAVSNKEINGSIAHSVAPSAAGESRTQTRANTVAPITTNTVEPYTDSPVSTPRLPSSISTGQKQRGSGTSSASPASPTVQEGFFNAITKRLHNVESNLTLSLQYLDDHSRYMQEAMHKAEKKQLSKVTIFLETLNQTVLTELRNMRDQYEQIWQSTVIALESQKEQSDRDIVALSSRLNLLADEVVFQKRMAIIQAVLLLCCLFLVIFSRGVPIPYLAPLLDQNVATGAYIPAPHSHLSTDQALEVEDDTIGSTNIPTHHHRDIFRQPLYLDPDIDMDAHGRPRITETAGSGGSTDSNTGDPDLRRHPSPPLTPSSQQDSAADSFTSAYEVHPQPTRRVQAYPQPQSRKPLPALPEHPSPERHTSC